MLPTYGASPVPCSPRPGDQIRSSTMDVWLAPVSKNVSPASLATWKEHGCLCIFKFFGGSCSTSGSSLFFRIHFVRQDFFCEKHTHQHSKKNISMFNIRNLSTISHYTNAKLDHTYSAFPSLASFAFRLPSLHGSKVENPST